MSNQTDVPEGYKRCTKCGEIKATGEFGRNKGGVDGLRSYCKMCQRESNHRYHQENLEAERERGRRYREENPEKERERGRRYREENPEKRREQRHRYYQENSEKEHESNRRYKKENSEKILELQRRWYQENPDKKREHDRRRRARKAQLPVACPTNIEAILLDAQNGQCMYCECDLLDGYHLDHIIPLALVDLLGDKHPGHVPSNLVLACQHCNSSKNATPLEDWLTWKCPDQMDEILHRVEAHIALMQAWEQGEGD